ncbi:MAG: MerR family transcriptional regulator [Saccharofermentanales bacterium]|jgi:DNA-binding transcriptional MerR regulator/predicted transcriptional regulator YdeE
MYKISDFSKMAQVTTKMLKYYEQCGLIKPAYTEPSTGYRYYDVEQLIPVSKIRTYLDMDFSTVEIKEMLNAEDNTRRFEMKLEELSRKIEDERRKMELLSFYKDAVKGHEFNQKYRVTLKTIDSKLSASKRLILPDAFDLLEHWQRHYENVQRSGSKILVFPNSLTCFHDEEFVLENNDIELMLFVEKRGKESESFEYKTLEGFKAVSIIHNGRYDFLSEAYVFIYRWIEFSGYRIVGDPMEAYLKSIYNTSDEDHFVTEILIPVNS